MDPNQFVNTGSAYMEASGGAPAAAGMAPYPLYGVGQTAEVVPFYRQTWFWGAMAFGASGVGAAWLYFGWWRPRSVRKNARKGLDGDERAEFVKLWERDGEAALGRGDALSASEKKRLRELERRARRSAKE